MLYNRRQRFKQRGNLKMYEGKIIKFHREKAGITQEQLGMGICSATHISKIERGLTEYSTEITTLLAEKLGINIDQEIRHLTNIKEKLDLWYEMIQAQNMEAAANIHDDLANSHLISISEYETLYKLLLAKYNLKQGHMDKVHKQIKRLPKDAKNLPEFEQNLLKHVLGIYYMAIENHPKSIAILRSIDFESYTNPLVLYDLATAYHYIHSPVLAYYYAEKALRIYKSKNNFLGIIDTENLMIIQVESDQHRDFKETVEQYENLINICEICNSPDKKAKILHNFAYEQLRRKNYFEAGKLYKQSMDLKEKQTAIYLLSLEGYIRSGYEGELLSYEELLLHVHEGLAITKEINDTLYTIVFNLHKYLILRKNKQYYRYLTNKAIPYFKEHGYILIAQQYERELFRYYSKNGETDRALEIAAVLVDSDGGKVI